MQNYWLSNLDYQVSKIKSINESSSYLRQKPEDEEPEDNSEDSEDNPESQLNERQKMMYEMYENITSMHGKFNQTSKGNGAHYASANLNPFKNEGLVCGNCVYFIGGGACEIVSGKIEPNAICKLWIIPEKLIKTK